MKNLLLIVLMLILNSISSCSNKNQKQNKVISNADTLEIKGSSWTSEKLDSTGRYYDFYFGKDNTYTLTSNIPPTAIKVMTGTYKLNSTTLILDDDTIQIKKITTDTIELLNGIPNRYRIFRNAKK